LDRTLRRVLEIVERRWSAVLFTPATVPSRLGRRQNVCNVDRFPITDVGRDQPIGADVGRGVGSATDGERVSDDPPVTVPTVPVARAASGPAQLAEDVGVAEQRCFETASHPQDVLGDPRPR